MTDLRDAVETARARNAEVVPRHPATAFDTVRRNTDVLRIIGLDPADPKSHAVVAVCDRYQLDPVLGHIAILGNSRLPYITRDGFLHIAHRSGQLDGIEVGDPHKDGAQWVTHASVYRKDMSRPFTYPGTADVGRDNGPEMAIARAERRALKRAFAVTLPGVFAEDEWDTRTPTPQTRPAAGDTQQRNVGEATARAASDADPRGAQPPLPDAQAEDYPEDYWDQPVPAKMLAQIHAAFRELGITDRAERLRIESDTAGRDVKSTKELTLAEAETLLTTLRDTAYAAASIGDDGEPAEDAES